MKHYTLVLWTPGESETTSITFAAGDLFAAELIAKAVQRYQGAAVAQLDDDKGFTLYQYKL